MSKFGIRDCVNTILTAAVLVTATSCTESLASQAAAPVQAPAILALSNAEPIGRTQLVSDRGLPVEVQYYNVKADLMTVSKRLALELTPAKGWKQAKSDELTVFSKAKPVGSVKWQRVAIFKGKLDQTFKHMPNSEKSWVNVIVYRVYKQ